LSNDGFLRLKRISSELFGVKKGLQDSGESFAFLISWSRRGVEKVRTKKTAFSRKAEYRVLSLFLRKDRSKMRRLRGLAKNAIKNRVRHHFTDLYRNGYVYVDRNGSISVAGSPEF
jgi:hypothetical protein